MTTWCKRFACWITKAKHTHSEYVTLITFPLHQWLHELVSMLRHTCIACSVPCLIICPLSMSSKADSTICTSKKIHVPTAISILMYFILRIFWPLYTLHICNSHCIISVCITTYFTQETKHTKIHFAKYKKMLYVFINPLNPELNPICYLLALLGAHHFLQVSRIRVKLVTLRLLMSYIYIYIYIYIWSTHS